MGTSKYTREILQEAVSNNVSINGVLRSIGIKSYSGSMGAHIKKRIQVYGIDTNHFLGLSSSRGKRPINRLEPFEVLHDGYEKRARTEMLRRAMIELGVPHICSKCGLSAIWQAETLVLVIDHINGDWSNNKLENLRFLCPNCHSQTNTFGAKNMRKREKPPIKKRAIRKRIRDLRSVVCRVCKNEFQTRDFRVKCCSRSCGNSRKQVPWPSPDKLEHLLTIEPATKLAKRLGVTSTAIKKHCKRLGIKTPPRGYWAKSRAPT